MRTHAMIVLALTLSAGVAEAQAPSLGDLAQRLAGIAAPLGHEQALADSILALLPAARRDRAGDVTLVLGQGGPRRLVVCPMDEPGWAVGGIRADGYLTIRRLPARVGPLFDQQLEGQRVTVLGSRGPVPGVVGVRSVHLTRGRSGQDAPFTFDDAYVDVGARTEKEARALGLEETSPIVLEKHPWRYGEGLLAAPMAGTRAACAALVRAASSRARGTVVVAFTVEQLLARRGMLTVAHEAGPFAETLLLDAGAVTDPVAVDSIDSSRMRAPLGTVIRWRLRDRFDGWPVETVSLADATRLEQRLREWIGGAP